MEVKEAIMFLRSHFAIGIYTKKSEEIIVLLKRLKQYEKREIISELFVEKEVKQDYPESEE